MYFYNIPTAIESSIKKRKKNIKFFKRKIRRNDTHECGGTTHIQRSVVATNCKDALKPFLKEKRKIFTFLFNMDDKFNILCK